MFAAGLRKRLFSRKLSELSGFSGGMIRAARVLWFAGREFSRDFCFERAASLAFATLISLIPLAALLLGLAVQFGVGDRFIGFAQQTLFKYVAPDFKEELAEWLGSNIATHAFTGSTASVTGLIALLTLVITALGLFTAAERSFNRVWKVSGSRTYFQKLRTFWLILTISPFIMMASLWIGEFMTAYLARLDGNSVALKTILYRYLIPLTIGIFGFTVLYRYLPATRVHVSSALLGAIVAAILWEFSKQNFYVYVGRTDSVRNFYGYLAIVPIFLIWVYLNWLIVLWGCELSYAHQNFRVLSDLLEKGLRTRQLPLAFVGVYLLERIGRSFQSGDRPPPTSAVGDELSIQTEKVDEAGERLAAAGILVEDARRAGQYTLGMSPDSISLPQVVSLLPSEEVPEDLLSVRLPGDAHLTIELFKEAERGAAGAFRDKTLAGLLAARHGETTTPRSGKDG